MSRIVNFERDGQKELTRSFQDDIHKVGTLDLTLCYIRNLIASRKPQSD